MDRRWSRRLLPAALVVSLLFSGWHQFRWWRLHNYWANQYVGGLKNSVIGFDRLRGITDVGERSLEMAWVYGGWHGLSSGGVLDVMVQEGDPHRVGILEHVHVEMAMFSRDLWAKRGLKPPEPGSRHNDLLPAEDVDKLARVRAIYRDHFDGAVVKSANYERQRRALIEAHRQLQEQGLTDLLAAPYLLDTVL